MKTGEYIKDHIYHILIWAAGTLLTAGTAFLLGTGFVLPVFIFIILTGAGFGVLFYDFRRKKRFYDDFLGKLDGLEEKYLVTEMLRSPEFLEGKILYESLADILKSMNDEIERHERVSMEFRSYVETWVHEIKLPIASMQLILHNNPGEAGRRLKEQVLRMENDVEQVLYYIRSEVPSNDYSIGCYSLREMAEDAVRENKDSLILNRFSVSVETGEEKVYTDRKWLTFMLGQIISNAVKYCCENHRMIRFYTEKTKETVTLWVQDNGRGIDSADLPRIFEKSFTGENGRKTASTGMGFYICHRLCRELGHRIKAESVRGEYTRIGIAFAAEKGQGAVALN